jgi:tetratricopeptide (TPR) repeat protein
MSRRILFIALAALAGFAGGVLGGSLRPEPAAAVASQPVSQQAVTAAKGEDLLRDVVGRPFDRKRSDWLFQRLSRHAGRIDETLERLNAEIDRDPASADLWCALATALCAKTVYATPIGPQQASVWERAVRAYDEAIRLDPNHWEARWGKAFGTSMAPEFVGLRPEAIRQFEELVEVQERLAPAPEQERVYARLGTLYKNAGNTLRARETWRRGLARFPGSKPLRQALELIGEIDG